MYLQLYFTVGLLLALTSAQTAPDAIQQVLKVVSEMNANVNLMNSNMNLLQSDMKAMTTNMGDLNLRVSRIENRRMTSELQGAQRLNKLEAKLDQSTAQLETKLESVKFQQSQATDEIRFNFKLLHSEVKTTATGATQTQAAVQRLDTRLDKLATSTNQSLEQLDKTLGCCDAASVHQTRLLTVLISQTNATRERLDEGLNGLATQRNHSVTLVRSELRQVHVNLTAAANVAYNATTEHLVDLSSQLRRIEAQTNNSQENLEILAMRCSAREMNQTLLLNQLLTKANKNQELIIASTISATDCKQLYDRGYTAAGVYTIYPTVTQPVLVYCSDGYTTLQRRSDGKESFDRTWQDYVAGFGQRDADHWIGLDAMHLLTAGRSCSLRIELLLDDDAQRNKDFYKSYPRDADGSLKHVTAARFSVGPAGNYTLLAETVSTDLQYNTYATQLNSYHSKLPFSTKDKNQSPSASSGNCAAGQSGGWWSKSCSKIDMNGSGGIGSGQASWYRSYCSADNDVCAYFNRYMVRSTHMRLRC